MWKQNRTLFEYFRFMGYLMMIVGVYLLVGGIGDPLSQYPQSGGSSDFGNGHRSGGLFPLWGAGAASQAPAKGTHREAEEIGFGDRYRI